MGMIRIATVQLLMVLCLHIVQQSCATGVTTYIRWGRSQCPDDATALYTGIVAGSWFQSHGGGANYLCLPNQPQWGSTNAYTGSKSYIYGTEYQFGAAANNGNPFLGMGAHGPAWHPKKLHDNDAPCVLCETRKSHIRMIPGWNTCPDTWTLEYTGYLVSEYPDHPGRTEFACLDASPEMDKGGKVNQNGALMYIVTGKCGSLPCPPYVEDRPITCAVCSK